MAAEEEAKGRKAAPRKGMRDRRFAISAAAIRLFTEKGLEATTVDDIAAAAGVAPRTFFRHFPTKEEAAFPDHDERIEDLRAKLAERRGAINPLASALDVTRSSALEYLPDPALYRPRFQLVRSIPALRDRERLIDYFYEAAIAEYLEAELGDQPSSPMRARALAAGIVAAVNYALDIWAETSEQDGRDQLDRGLLMVEQAFAPMIGSAMTVGTDSIMVTIPATEDVRDPLVRLLGEALAANGGGAAARGSRRD